MSPIRHEDHVVRDPVSVPGTRPGGRVGTRWAVAVLLLGTLLLVGYLVVLWAAAALVVSLGIAVGLLDGGSSLDVSGLVLDVAPGVLTGWAAGLLAARVLPARPGLGPRLGGAFAGLLGCVLGALVLRSGGIL